MLGPVSRAMHYRTPEQAYSYKSVAQAASMLFAECGGTKRF
jgi:hypothetical protein